MERTKAEGLTVCGTFNHVMNLEFFRALDTSLSRAFRDRWFWLRGLLVCFKNVSRRDKGGRASREFEVCQLGAILFVG